MKLYIGILVSILFYWGTAFVLVCVIDWSVRAQDARTLFLMLPLVLLAHGLLVRIFVTVKTARKKGW